jgi:hypothetical protein
MAVNSNGWSGEGEFTQRLLDRLKDIPEIASIRVEDAPASRSEADYNFVSNEIFVAFGDEAVVAPRTRFGFFRRKQEPAPKAMTIPALEATLTAIPEVGAPDYSDDSMLQYLRTERIVPPYQTRGYKLVELVRIYEVGSVSRPPA